MTDTHMQPPRNAFGAAALVLAVLGILGLIVGSVVAPLFWAAGALTVIAVVLGALGTRRAKRAGTDNRATAVTGAVLGALATAWFLNGALVTTNAFPQVSCAAPQQSPASPGANTGTSASTADGGGPLGYDTTRCFEDGVQVTASAPEPYALGKEQRRRQDADAQGKRIVSVQITIRNGSTSVLDLDEFYSIGAKDADGRQAQALFEGDDHSSGLGRTLLLPGMKKVVTQRFALPPNAATRLDTEVEFARAADRRTWLTAQGDERVGWSGPVR